MGKPEDPLNIEESYLALNVAGYAQEFLNEFAAGKVTGETLISLAHAVREFELNMIPPSEGDGFHARAEGMERHAADSVIRGGPQSLAAGDEAKP